MAAADGNESQFEATTRREEFALEAIRKIVRQKAGNKDSHGKSSVTLHWRAGVLELVTVGDEANYK